MAITQAIANAFKKQLLEGDVNFKSSGGDVYSEEYDTKAEQARAGAEAIGAQMPGALGGMSKYLEQRRKHMEEMNKLLGR